MTSLSLRPQWQAATRAFEGKTSRERMLMLSALLAALYFVIDLTVMTPQHKRIRQWQAQAEVNHGEIQRVQKQVTELSAQLAALSAGDKQAELDELMRIIAEADSLLSEDDGSSLKLSALLNTMLRTTPGLKLMSLKTLPVVPLLPRGPQASDGTELKPSPPMMGGKPVPEQPPIAVHQHGVEIAVKGNYLALLPYMEKLRRYPKRLFWTNAALEVVKYPDSVLRLTITTLSEQRQTPLVPHGDKASAAAAPSATSQPAAAVPAPAPASPPAAAPAAPAASAAPAAKAAPASQAATPSRESKP